MCLENRNPPPRVVPQQQPVGPAVGVAVEPCARRAPTKLQRPIPGVTSAEGKVHLAAGSKRRLLNGDIPVCKQTGTGRH